MKTRSASSLLLALLLVFLPLAPQVQAATLVPDIPDPRFGVVEAYQAPDAATALGAGWTRVTFRWNEIQPDGPEQWNVVPISDEALNRERAQGRQVVGLLVTTPGWATDQDVGPGVPRGLHLPADHPGNLWANFVRTIVSRYAGRIDHWVIWNEPDIPETHHMSWGGSTDDFVRLLQVGYTVANEANPNAVIHMAAVTHWWNEDWYGQFLAALTEAPGAAANNHYFDVATLHVYFQPETVYDITAHYRDMMRGYGINKPIWIGETNAAPSQDPVWPVPNAQFDVSLEQQAAFVIQAFSLGLAAGAERVAVYKMADTPTDRQANPEPFGLVRQDGSRRPAFRAFQVAATHLAGFRNAWWDRRDTVSVVTVDRGDRTTTVVWSRTPEAQTAMIPARTTQALRVDASGSTRHIYPERGYYYVDLPGAYCPQGCKIGGSPYLLVERAPASADTAPTPKPATPTATGTAVADATPQPSQTPLPPPSTRPSPTASVTATPYVQRSRTPTPSSTPSATPSATPTATSTPTISPTPSSPPRPSATPSPVATPAAPTAAADRHAWILIGVLVMGLGGVALAYNKRI